MPLHMNAVFPTQFGMVGYPSLIEKRLLQWIHPENEAVGTNTL